MIDTTSVPVPPMPSDYRGMEIKYEDHIIEKISTDDVPSRDVIDDLEMFY